ncbi:MAG: IS30 family transposase [Bacteroidetes bacterium HGW-Bacteroidetes-14]|jgi:IS30 family transposase|nr:MAG: IS30 family transposase [Bacteroidetes bacterium HGW-Bacteroidetes-14]
MMKHLTVERRYEISAYLRAGLSKPLIANLLGVNKTTIYREIERNGYGRYRTYKSKEAQRRAEYRWNHRKLPRKLKGEMLEKAKELLMEEHYSPEQIAGDCKKKGVAMVSHEAIYQWIWNDKKNGGYLFRYLRHQQRRYRKRGRKSKKRGAIQNRVDISQRPSIVDERTRFGDFEMDTIIGASHSEHILTINDRATGIVRIRKMLNASAAEALRQAVKALKPMSDNGLVKTITSDNGIQFAYHQEIAKELNADFFFATPYHSWERGSNENTNGLIRQYIPKGTSFKNITIADLEEIEAKLNNRPRKRYKFSTPNEMFNYLTGKNQKVAFTI